MNADKEGFLVGEPIEIDATSQGRTMQLWRDIKRDTKGILNALGAANKIAEKTRVALPKTGNGKIDRASTATATTVAKQRDSKGRFVSAPKAAVPSVNKSQSKATADATAAIAKVGAVEPSISTQKRKANGQFGSGDGGGSGGGAIGSIRDGIDRIADNTSASLDNVDPVVDATREISGSVKVGWNAIAGLWRITAGITKGLYSVFRGGRLALSFAKSSAMATWRVLRGGGDKTLSVQKRILKELKDINEKSNSMGGKEGGGLFSKIAEFLKNIPGLGALLVALAPAIKFLARNFLKLGIPIGILLGALKGLTTSTEEYAKRMGLEAGQGFWSDLGIRILGVFGDIGNTLTGGLAGKFGEYIAPAVSDMVEGILNTWDGAIEVFTKAWRGVVTMLSDGIDAIAELPSKILSAITSMIATAVRGYGDMLSYTLTALGDSLPDIVGKPLREAAKRISGTMGGVADSMEIGGANTSGIANISDLSSKFESSGDIGAVATDTDGFRAYGKYQFNSGKGGVNAFFAANPEYKKQFAGLAPGSKEFDDKWKDLAYNDKEGFKAAQDKAAIQQYYAPNAQYAKDLGFNTNNFGVQSAIFSGAIQHGGIKKILRMASAGTPGFDKLSPEKQVELFYNARASYSNAVKMDGGPETNKKVIARLVKEKVVARALALQNGGAIASPVIPASPTAPAIPRVPNVAAMPTVAPVKIPPSPPVIGATNTPKPGQGNAPVIIRSDKGKNLGNDAIANNAKGGMGTSKR